MTPNDRVCNLSARTGYFFRNFYNEGVYRGDRVLYQTSSVGVPGVPPVYQQPRGYTNVPSNIGRDKGKGPRLGFQFDGTVFVSAWGQHQMKAGLQIITSASTRSLEAPATESLSFGIGVSWEPGARSGITRCRATIVCLTAGLLQRATRRSTMWACSSRMPGRIGRRFTIHVGLRTEKESVPSLSPDPRVTRTQRSDSVSTTSWPPGSALRGMPPETERLEIYGSWGVFYDITKLQLSFAFGGGSSVGYWYTLDSADIGTLVDNQDCPPACPGRLIARSATGVLIQRPRRQSHRSRTPSNATPGSGGWR